MEDVFFIHFILSLNFHYVTEFMRHKQFVTKKKLLDKEKSNQNDHTITPQNMKWTSNVLYEQQESDLEKM